MVFLKGSSIAFHNDRVIDHRVLIAHLHKEWQPFCMKFCRWENVWWKHEYTYPPAHAHTHPLLHTATNSVTPSCMLAAHEHIHTKQYFVCMHMQPPLKTACLDEYTWGGRNIEKIKKMNPAGGYVFRIM